MNFSFLLFKEFPSNNDACMVMNDAVLTLH